MPLPHSVLFTCSKHIKMANPLHKKKKTDLFLHKIILKLGTVLTDISKGAYITSIGFYTEYKFWIYLYICIYIVENTLRSKFVVIWKTKPPGIHLILRMALWLVLFVFCSEKMSCNFSRQEQTLNISETWKSHVSWLGFLFKLQEKIRKKTWNWSKFL